MLDSDYFNQTERDKIQTKLDVKSMKTERIKQIKKNSVKIKQMIES